MDAQTFTLITDVAYNRTLTGLLIGALFVAAAAVPDLRRKPDAGPLDRQVQAQGTVVSVEQDPEGQAVTLRLAEDPDRSLEFAGPDRELLTEWKGKSLTATCTGMDDPQALTECQMGRGAAEPDTAPDGRSVERSTEPYTD